MVRPHRAAARLAAAATGLLLLVPAAPATAGWRAGGGADPGRYENPLEPRIPGGGVVESCADPAVLRGQAEGDPYWYLYCTTDPLNAEQRDADGELVFSRIPQMRSLDLVDWEYVGDATDALPPYAAPEAALWAPDVVWSEAFEQYYLFVGVTDTTATDCTTDNAIGVATSASPTGPWTFAPEPVVGPREDPASDDPCAFFWTYDPDVLGDAVGSESTFYYGSYYGGVFGAPIALTEDGATLGASTPIAIPNRYEGTNVVERDGWYYLFASATNCCNGALTGYSVFAGRSRDPLGPFVDREGASLLDSEVGGTPVLSMNGNRWVGLGHNSVFQDAAGDWWTAYHAVDRFDPFFASEPGFTKRPVLLDAVDWVGGWPAVRGGRWASDEPQPAPAGQPGERSRHEVELVDPLVPGLRLRGHSDDFGDGLERAWRWVREPAAEVVDGELVFPVQAADLFVDSNTASVLTREAPAGDYVVETTVRMDVPADGQAYNFAQGGLVVYGGDDAFVKLVEVAIFETRQTEWAKEIPVAEPEGQARYGNTVVGPPGDRTSLRIVVERLDEQERAAAGGDTERYTAYTRRDGGRWVRGGVWTHSLGEDARIGLVSMGGGGDFTTVFEDVAVRRLAR